MEDDSASFKPSFDDTATLMTASGRELDPINPVPSSISLEDIAHGLAHQCRSAGQTISFYSVALHSIYVAKELERIGEPAQTQLYGILHDAAEAYLSDVPAPIKKHLGGYSELEDAVQNAIWHAFELQSPELETYQQVKTVDRYLREFEFATILPHFTENTNPPDLPYDLHADSKINVKRKFISMTTDLSTQCSVSIPE